MNYNEMKKRLLEACDSYYNKSESIMSDKEFDELKDEFTRLYPDDEFITKIGSPVPEVTEWKKESHKIPMASLDKVNLVNEFINWLHKKKSNDFIVESKIDGISMDLEYQNGYLVKAITRGDGKTGENILRNVVKMKNVKRRISNFNGSIRGEIVLCKDDFVILNRKMKDNNEKEFVNERNAASGIAKKFNGDNAEFLTIFYYDVTGDWKTEEDKMKWIESQGLKTSYWKKCTQDECIQIYNDFENKLRSEMPYIIDGLVIKIDDMKIQEKLGYSVGSGNPNSQVAWKFGAETAKTKVINVEWQLGNSSRITPVLIMEPVKLCGVTIQRASVHNLGMFNDFNFHVGDVVLIERCNDVIPGVIENLSNHTGARRGDKLEVPKNCPVCGEKASVGGIFLECKNESCSGNEVGNLAKWVKKLDLKGIATATLERLYEAGLVKTPSDLYRLKPNMICELEGFGSSSANKIVETLNSKKELSFGEFIGGLNISNFSDKTAELLEKNGLDTVQKIMQKKDDELASIHGIGMVTAKAIREGLSKKINVINQLNAVGITIMKKEKIMKKSSGSKLSGKSFVFTGAIERIDPETSKHYTRDKLQEFVVMNGGINSSSLSKETTYLVQADPSSQSTKTQKAQKFGTSIISEIEFFKMIGM